MSSSVRAGRCLTPSRPFVERLAVALTAEKGGTRWLNGPAKASARRGSPPHRRFTGFSAATSRPQRRQVRRARPRRTRRRQTLSTRPDIRSGAWPGRPPTSPEGIGVPAWPTARAITRRTPNRRAGAGRLSMISGQGHLVGTAARLTANGLVTGSHDAFRPVPAAHQARNRRPERDRRRQMHGHLGHVVRRFARIVTRVADRASRSAAPMHAWSASDQRGLTRRTGGVPSRPALCICSRGDAGQNQAMAVELHMRPDPMPHTLAGAEGFGEGVEENVRDVGSGVDQTRPRRAQRGRESRSSCESPACRLRCPSTASSRRCRRSSLSRSPPAFFGSRCRISAVGAGSRV